MAPPDAPGTDADADTGTDTDTVAFDSAIVGVQKAATSTLYELLAQHPGVAVAPDKEQHFFNRARADWEHPDYSGYAAPRRSPAETSACDATPSYLFWPRVLERMRDYSPDLRLIASFRDPVQRAFSHWNMDFVRGRESAPFGEVVARGRLAGLPPRGRWRLPAMQGRTTVARGLYGRQLRRGLELFERPQWLLLRFEDVTGDPVGAGDAAARHLGLAPHGPRPIDSPRRRNASATSVAAPPVRPDDVSALVADLADDLELFRRLSGLDVGSWPTARVLAGDLGAADLADELNHKAGLGG